MVTRVEEKLGVGVTSNPGAGWGRLWPQGSSRGCETRMGSGDILEAELAGFAMLEVWTRRVKTSVRRGV